MTHATCISLWGHGYVAWVQNTYGALAQFGSHPRKGEVREFGRLERFGADHFGQCHAVSMSGDTHRHAGLVGAPGARPSRTN